MFSAEELGRSVGYYPLVGVALGLLLAGLDAGLGLLFPLGVRTALVLAAWVVVTGALHLDGFLDSCDGVLGGRTPEQRLEILRDERVGAFGLSAGVLLLLLKYAALSAVAAPGALTPNRAAALVLAPTFGRWGMAIVIGAFPYGRAQGLGRTIKDHAGKREILLATGIALAVAVVGAGWVGVAVLAGVGLAAWGVARFALARLPGLTGDLYGAVCEVVETLALVLFAMNGLAL
jgi:adenosylcobinamide-GDP ribazoletransferase